MKKIKKVVLSFGIFVLVVAILSFFPTWTPDIKLDNSIAKLVEEKINGVPHTLLIRGNNLNNPILLIIHGGPATSEIPYVTKYQKELEKDFTVVHYDQRGSGKSFKFLTDYNELDSSILVEDLLAVTDWLKKELNQNEVILMGHSYGSYLSIQAIQKAPDKFLAYVGVGQVGNSVDSEKKTWEFCFEEATKVNNVADMEELRTIKSSIENDDGFVPRELVRKYGGAIRKINDNLDYLQGFLFRPEYNLSDVIRFFGGIAATQEQLVTEPINTSFLIDHSHLDLPIYFAMGKYDYMTSTETAKDYFEMIEAPSKKFVVFEDSAHYPQFEEIEAFSIFMQQVYKESRITAEQ